MLADVLHPSPSAQSVADGIANNHPGTSMNGDDIYNVDDNTNLRIQVEDAFRGSGQLHRQQPQLEDEYTSQSPEEALRDQGRGSPPSYEGRFHKAVQPHLTKQSTDKLGVPLPPYSPPPPSYARTFNDWSLFNK